MMQRIVIFFTFIFLTVTAFAIDTGKARCVTCQNQTIKDSNAFIAADLRREIRRLMEEGKDDDEIADFLVTRYGDFVLYRPRFAGKTLALWIAPFLLVLFGGFAIFRVIRHRMTLSVAEDGKAQ
jgi:cytochrome c-type biogenesis protein CcmH